MDYTPTDDDFFHVSRKQFRDSIEKHGLKAQEVYNEQSDEAKGPGVWVSSMPEEDYGTDVYRIDNPVTEPGRGYPHFPTFKHGLEEDDEGHTYIPKDVPVSDFNRVGHIHRRSDGHTEVHWHKEEDCPSNS
jgi:hypothetical protein